MTSHSDDAVRTLVLAYFSGLSDHDADVVANLVTADFVNEHTGEMGDGCVGRTEYRERLPQFFNQLQELHYTVERVIVDGTTAAAPYRLTASIDGRQVNVRGVMIIDSVAGLISRRTDYWDGLTVQHQLD